MNRNNIADDGARSIAGALEVNSALETLEMRRNNIADEAARLITEALKVNASIVSIDVSPNKISGNVKWELTRMPFRKKPLFAWIFTLVDKCEFLDDSCDAALKQTCHRCNFPSWYIFA